ncbi:MAG: hypothetical protein EON59_05695 [Alphaproteobacteria bacterium]|nr:MAG: hypothetical protein EON59_05695 [Alphaproteobacteria bacterium]
MHRPTERLRGRRAVAQRKRRVMMHPLCADCAKEDVVKTTDEIDHVKPLAQGGSDTDDNVQGLCFHHHAIKTAREDHGHEGAANHPAWLQPSAIPLEIVCGPPCSGKTTYVHERANPGDVVIDLDEIQEAIEPRFRHWSDHTDGQLLNKAIRTRNAMLGALSRATSGKAFLIVSAPNKAERDWWASQTGGNVTLLDPGPAECKRRAKERGTPNAIRGVDEWHMKAGQPWTPSKSKRNIEIGLDGFPVE